MLFALDAFRLTENAKYEAALDAYRRSSEIIVKAFGADNSFYAENLRQRADVYISQADHAQASLLAERSVQVFERSWVLNIWTLRRASTRWLAHTNSKVTTRVPCPYWNGASRSLENLSDQSIF